METTPTTVATGYHRSKSLTPTWKGTLLKQDHITKEKHETSPPISPLHFTLSQLDDFTDPTLSQDTLNSSRLTHTITERGEVPPPLIVRTPGKEVHRQEGTILRAREQPCCQRVPLVAMGKPGTYSREEVFIYPFIHQFFIHQQSPYIYMYLLIIASNERGFLLVIKCDIIYC